VNCHSTLVKVIFGCWNVIAWMFLTQVFNGMVKLQINMQILIKVKTT